MTETTNGISLKHIKNISFFSSLNFSYFPCSRFYFHQIFYQTTIQSHTQCLRCIALVEMSLEEFCEIFWMENSSFGFQDGILVCMYPLSGAYYLGCMLCVSPRSQIELVDWDTDGEAEGNPKRP